MKKAVASMVVMICLAGLAAAVSAEDKIRIGMIDIRRVLLDSKPGQTIRGELEAMVKERREKLSKEESAIKALEEKLEKDKLVLTDKQKDEKRKEIEDRIAALRKMAEGAQQEVAKRDNELSGKATAVVRDIVADISKQEKFTMVLDKNMPGILWVDEPVDVTERVIKAYDAKAGK